MKNTTNKIKLMAIIAFLAVAFISCGKKKAYDNADALGKLKTELVDKFGKDAHYTNFNVINDENGTVVSVTVTKDPSSLKMEQWTSVNGSWKQNSEVTLEISGSAKAEEFMFKLDKIMDIDLLAKCVEEAKKKVVAEKKIAEVSVNTIGMNAPSDGNFNTTKYFITIKPKQGGTSFNFWYNLDGTLDKFDY